MKEHGNFSLLLLAFLLSWALIIGLTIAVYQWASFAGIALALAMVVIVWMVNVTDKVR